MVQLKLAPLDSGHETTAQLHNAVEAEIRTWAAAKPILNARRLMNDRTRGIRMGDVVHLHRRLVGPYEPFFADPSRESRIETRVIHALGDDRGRWNSILSTD
ncbi:MULTISPECIES: hypothetical protein [unclassified Mycolicibacterium]|uniref:hypothetical protein n=1 Tax=unclassified Mycolicibacterium TaxID=2636767 RepID=UPI0012DF0E85|nr:MULTISPECIES: hypothetical protein [unclassified Mycolicibacterium]MUL82012.1 hypothetical protein [Mycolicibacterium sp. CBMA 329]MUL87778.1 hypothetical protein [Mycolicibacterium sp. CBMA 331]MUM01602.1 hypothetical protein [Mycolicibacterium sp. CBMA 334]MUM27274.1 hypothetical protein [Mycolicibacterium sp. CBMA 295]MUM38075.1 hypothetical protein [Mycolicibacterium sp. CBMA 247]